MKLSDRLQTLADQIEPGETMADIGTDHGFLPIYLTEKAISPHVILTDISRGSLEKALEDCRSYDACRKFDLRWGDGLTVLSPGEVDAVVIAGMGGLLIAEILERDPVLSRSFGKFLLQPRTQVGQLRYRLECLGFVIEKEFLVRERRRICEILLARPGAAKEPILSYEETPEVYDYPESLIRIPGMISREYLQGALAKQERNLERTKMAKCVDQTAVSRMTQTIRRLKCMIKEVESHEQSILL